MQRGKVTILPLERLLCLFALGNIKDKAADALKIWRQAHGLLKPALINLTLAHEGVFGAGAQLVDHGRQIRQDGREITAFITTGKHLHRTGIAIENAPLQIDLDDTRWVHFGKRSLTRYIFRVPLKDIALAPAFQSRGQMRGPDFSELNLLIVKALCPACAEEQRAQPNA